MTKQPQTVIVTGASSGLGLHTAQQLNKAGFRVIAGARSFHEAGQGSDGIYRHALDVTSEASIADFMAYADTVSPRMDALVQCAGMLILGSCEETSAEEYRRVMDTDFLGMVRMNHEVLPRMRKAGGGRIVMFSSINGLLGIPFQSAYTAAKHAVEGYAECLQMECRRYHIEVCLVEPGDHRSGSSSYRAHAAAMTEQSPYDVDFESATYVIHRDETGGSDPDRLGAKVAKTLKRRHLPVRLRVASADQHLAVLLHDLLTPGMNGWILRCYYFGKNKAAREAQKHSARQAEQKIDDLGKKV